MIKTKNCHIFNIGVGIIKKKKNSKRENLNSKNHKNFLEATQFDNKIIYLEKNRIYINS